MRTTLELDDRVVAIARARAHARGTSLGKEVSELALRGLEPRGEVVARAGFPTIPSVPGHVVTPEMVAAALEE